jgi:hypothetical protein
MALQGKLTPIVRPFGNNIGDIYNYESDGIYKQTQVMVSLNTSIGRRATIFTRYAYSDAHSDTDGLNTMPSNPYNFRADWGRTGLNVSHNFFLGGSVTTKYGIRLSPFLVARTGTPFNITTGTDLYLQGTGQPSARPTVVSDPTLTGAKASPLGTIYYPFVPVGDPTIERYSGTGTGFIGLNLRISKTWGFGPTRFKGVSGGARAGGGGGHGGRGFGGFGGGPGGGMGDSTEHRYNLTFSVNARNVLNHENLNTFNGSLTSPIFFQPNNITSGFGPGGGGGDASASNQRRIDLQLRFAF